MTLPRNSSSIDVSYSDVAHSLVPEPTIRMRERVLFYLRSLAEGETVTAKQMVDHLRRNRLPEYPYSRCIKDLRVLKESGLARSDRGWPQRWSAR
jgi:hypothetical protein